MVDVGSVAVAYGTPEYVSPPVEHTSLRVDRSLRLRLRGVVPRRMDVLPSPGPVGIEDTPAVRVHPDVEAAATRGDAAARLWRIPVEAGFAVGVVGDDEVAVVSDAARKEAELAIHVPADARGRAAQAVGVRRVRVDEDDL